jgi:polyferredoxin
VQAVWAVGTNAYLPGFASGSVYGGVLKTACVPGLNCYACPGALGSCPIGAVQAIVGSIGYNVPYYMIGFLLLVGGALGRFVCGFLCPFGLIQELLYKIPFGRKILSFKGDRQLRLVKYGILAVFVVLLPMFAVNAAGGGAPWFCTWICPVGALEGGIPLVLGVSALRGAVGFLYAWKVAILAAVLVLSVFVYRPFCRYLCPLGAVYAPMNRIALLKYRVREDRCARCGHCAEICPMRIDPRGQANHPECVRCGKCRASCPSGAIEGGFAM